MVIGKPPRERCQSVGSNPVDSPAPLRGRAYKPRSLHELEVLNDGTPCNRQHALELARGAWHAANTLEDNDPNRVPKQAEQTKHASQLDSAGMGFGHRDEVSRCANSFDKPKLLCSTRSDPYINRNDR